MPLLLSEGFLFLLRITLTYFTLFSYKQAPRLPTCFRISGLDRLKVKPRLHRSYWRAFAFTHHKCFLLIILGRLLLLSFSPLNLPSFTLDSTLTSPCFRSDPPLTRQGAALAHLDFFIPYDLVLWTDGSAPFLFAKDGSGVLANCSFCGTVATLSFSAGQVYSSFSAEAYAIPHALCWSRQHQQVCHLSSLILLSDSCSVLAALFSPPPFLLSQTLWRIWQKLSSLSFCTSGYSGFSDTRFSRGTTRVMSWPDREHYLRPLQSLVVSLALSLVSTLVFSRTGGLLSHLNSLTQKFLQFSPRNLCVLVMFAVFFLVYAATDIAFC